MNKKILHSTGVSVGYEKHVIVDNIEFDVKAGEILTLIGPNGSGKSTLLKTITKQLEPVKGDIFLKDGSMNKMREDEIAKEMSILMTERMKPELMTCRDIVSTGRYPYTGKLGILSEDDWKKVEEAMKTVNVWDLKDRLFSNISDGQSQRVMMARAICQEPELLVMDEPTSFLDICHKLELLSILKRLVKENNLAVFMSLHELDLAQKIADKVLCINNGRVERAGTPEEIFTSDYIKELYGIENGAYIEQYGSLEFSTEHGDTEVFVIGGGGKGAAVFRRLQKLGIGFATGVIHEGDLDYPVAEILADELVAEKAFAPISPEACRKAEEIMDRCRYVICAVEDFGPMNEANRQLLDKARQQGKLKDSPDDCRN